MLYLMRAFALFLTDIKVSNAPFESGLKVRTEENGYIIDIAFDMLLATSTDTLMTLFIGLESWICNSSS